MSSPTDNSGIFIRTPALGVNDPANDWKLAVDQGYEIQIDNTGFNPDNNSYKDPFHKTGAIYTLAPSTASMPSIGQWHTFDPRNNVPRIGRVLIARGRDATDVAISNAFGPNTLTGFTVWTNEVSGYPQS